MEQRLGLPVPDDYAPSDGEIDNLVYLTLKFTVNWGMRQCDLAVCVALAGGKDKIVGDAGISELVSVTCEYAWDHIAGEPDEVTSEQLFEHMKPILNNWYGQTTPEERAQTA